MQAAKKAFRQIAKASGKESCTFVFTIVESTRGSGGKEFTYSGSRILLDKPTTITKDGHSINIKYETVVKSYKPKTEAKKTKKAPKKTKQNRARSARKETPPDDVEEENIVEEVLDEDSEHSVVDPAEDSDEDLPPPKTSKKTKSKSVPKKVSKAKKSKSKK
jgi:hypothetical protein